MFYYQIKKECDKRGVKITPLVAECGGAKGSLSNWKKGASPNSDIVIKLAQKLNVTTDYLLGLTEDPAPSKGNITVSTPQGEEINLQNFKEEKQMENQDFNALEKALSALTAPEIQNAIAQLSNSKFHEDISRLNDPTLNGFAALWNDPEVQRRIAELNRIQSQMQKNGLLESEVLEKIKALNKLEEMTKKDAELAQAVSQLTEKIGDMDNTIQMLVEDFQKRDANPTSQPKSASKL